MDVQTVVIVLVVFVFGMVVGGAILFGFATLFYAAEKTEGEK